ncbi:restriction endonuclease subunit S [Pseudoalteromonas sp. APM04]|uniref:restriction endonuclease subunit S n=1 Tax=Pseudoalteromonas sp. APM04 TaxID=2699396 RepID=UPI001FB1C1C2|nr:restriction endonuclease subunit S [Pseudoalteromonas sp. APM04]UOB73647.1 restriction endonuclease subunit S [Pseudoalteromonas sp. APM04]
MSEVKTDLNSFDSRLDLNNLDKSNWKTYRFDEIAKNISERVDPNNTDLKVYIGLEHIDSESLHIKRHGTPDDVNGQKLKFYKGDIIFGRRRAYQRKAGIATCDGFCSAHALVLRANSSVIEPELFPFFLHSDQFMNRAIDISVGSLSPTINWGTLKNQSFILPPKEMQSKFINLFSSVNELVNAKTIVLNRQKVFNFSREKAGLHGENISKNDRKDTAIGLLPSSWKVVPLTEVAWFQEGPGLRKWQFTDEGIKVINVTNLVEGKLDLTLTNRHVSLEEFNAKYQHFECDENDIVIASSGNSYCKHGVVKKHDLPLMMNTSVIRFKPLDGVDFNYLNQFLKSKSFKKQIDKLITGAAQPNFGPFHLKKVLFPLPESIDEQIHIGLKLEESDDRMDLLLENLDISKQLQLSLINKVF